MEFKFGEVTICVANNFSKESPSVYDADLLFENIDKAIEIAERSMIVDFTSLKIETKVDTESGYKIIAEVNLSGLIFDDIPTEETDVPIYDVEWTEFPIELQEKISENLIMLMINDWLEEDGLPSVSLDTPDSEITLEQKQCIIQGIVRQYANEDAPEDLNEEEVNNILKGFGFNFDSNGDINE
jgi:hypothetical protein